MLGVVKEIFDSNQQVAVVVTCPILFPSIRRVHGCCDHCTLSLPRAPPPGSFHYAAREARRQHCSTPESSSEPVAPQNSVRHVKPVPSSASDMGIFAKIA